MRNRILLSVLAVVVFILLIAVFLGWPDHRSDDASPLAAQGAQAPEPTDPGKHSARIPPTHDEPAPPGEPNEVTEIFEQIAPGRTWLRCAFPDWLSPSAVLGHESPLGIGPVGLLDTSTGELIADVATPRGSLVLTANEQPALRLSWDGSAADQWTTCTIERVRTITVRGVVVNSMGEPVGDVAVKGCDRGRILRTGADGAVEFPLTEGQRCQPVVTRRIDGILWFDLMDPLGGGVEDVLNVEWVAPQGPGSRQLTEFNASSKSGLWKMRDHFEAQFAPVLSRLEPVRSLHPAAAQWHEQVQQERDTVVGALDELLEDDVPIERLEDFILLGEAAF